MQRFGVENGDLELEIRDFPLVVPAHKSLHGSIMCQAKASI
jgi:hypothetical protein